MPPAPWLQQACAFGGGAWKYFYAAQPEWATVKLHHATFSPVLGAGQTAMEMEGSLLDSDGEPVDPCRMYAAAGHSCPDNEYYRVVVGEVGVPDIMPIQALLDAAGVDMDAISDFSENDGTETVRYAGLVLVLNIEYIPKPWSREWTYAITAQHVPGVEFKYAGSDGTRPLLTLGMAERV